MTTTPTIDEYLCELAAALPAAPRLRSRVLTEAEDHLQTAVESRVTSGVEPAVAEQQALRSFGPADEVARGVAESVVQGAVRRAFGLGLILFVVVTVCSDLVTSDFANFSASWLADGAGTVLTWIIGQVALVAGTLSVIRALAHTLGQNGAAQLYVVRGMLVVVSCAAVALSVDAAGVLTGPSGRPLTADLLVVAALGASLSAVAAAVRLVTLATACLLTLEASQAVDGTIATDTWRACARIAAAARCRIPAAAPLLRVLARSAGRSRSVILHRAPWLADWLDNRRYPWRFAALAMIPLATVTVCYAIVQGQLSGGQAWNAATIAWPLMLAVFECSLALLGYATLGRYLGLWRYCPTRPSIRSRRKSA